MIFLTKLSNESLLGFFVGILDKGGSVNLKLNKLILMAVLIALSVIGSTLKVFSTVAFDSLPAYLAAILLGPLAGGIIGGLGHLITALTAGFPLGVLVHLITILAMVVTMGVYGYGYRKLILPFYLKALVLGLVGWLFNAVLPLVLLIPIAGQGLFMAFILPLTLATLANLYLALIIAQLLPDSIKERIV